MKYLVQFLKQDGIRGSLFVKASSRRGAFSQAVRQEPDIVTIISVTMISVTMEGEL